MSLISQLKQRCEIRQAVGLLLCSLLQSAYAQPRSGFALPGYAVLPVKASTDQGLAKNWKIMGANLQENFTATWGVVDIQNISAKAISEAQFYGEYLDGDGRLCFALAFAAEANRDHITTPVAAGEGRRLLSVAPALSPAIAPVELRLYLIRQKIEGRVEQFLSSDQALVTPPVTGGVGSAQLKVHLTPEQRQLAFVDVAAARIQVNGPGRPPADHIEIMRSLSPTIASWARSYIRQVYFESATHGLAVTPAKAIVLIRILNNAQGVDPGALLSRESPWIKEDSAGITGDAPMVTQLILQPVSNLGLAADPEQQRPRPQDPDLFELTSAGSDWSMNVLRPSFQMGPNGWIRRLVWRSVEELGHQ